MRSVVSPPLKCFCQNMPKTAGVLVWDIFGLYDGNILVKHGMPSIWTLEELREVIGLLQRPEFKRAAAAVL